ncbi:MAG: hypothetical protein GXO43_06965 [Crenarchaeota archaeon]|nr:hypothetical protein [Thermoproteota archaeon]
MKSLKNDCILLHKARPNPDIDGVDLYIYLLCPDDHITIVHYEPLWDVRDLHPNEYWKLIMQKLEETKRHLELKYGKQ